MNLITQYRDIDVDFAVINGDVYSLRRTNQLGVFDVYRNDVTLVAHKVCALYSIDAELFLVCFKKIPDEFISYKMTNEGLKLIKDGYKIFSKINSIFVSKKGDFENLMIALLNNRFLELAVFDFRTKVLLYADEEKYIIMQYDRHAADKKYNPQNSSCRVIECLDYSNKSIWAYTSDHLFHYQNDQATKYWNAKHGINDDRSIEDQEKFHEKKAVLFSPQSAALFIAGVLLVSTDCNWLIGIELTSGKELWIIKHIEELDFRGAYTKDGDTLLKAPINYNFLKADTVNKLVYYFGVNQYFELDPLSGRITNLDNKLFEFASIDRSRGSFHYFKVDDIVYYTTTVDSIEESKDWASYLVGYDVIKKQVVFEYKLGKFKKDRLALLGSRRFELVGNKFFILDNTNTLWIFEDTHFSLRHPNRS